MAIGKDKADAELVGEKIAEVVNEKSKDELKPMEVVGETPGETTEEHVISGSDEQMKQYIYVGPNFPGLTSYTVIDGKDKYPVHIKKIVTGCPSVGKLFVPVAELTSVEPATKTKGTLEYRNYTKAIEYLAELRKEGE